MSPVTHFLLGWVTANTTRLNRRERAMVTIAGVIPDADGLGLVAEVATRHSDRPLLWWSEYHHVLGHNLGFCLAVTVIAIALATRRWVTAALVCLSFHLHLVGDLVGARGPDGEQWPIPYLSPFSAAWSWTCAGQWPLNGWPNLVLTAGLIAVTLRLTWSRGYSPLEIFSRRADQGFVDALRKRFPATQSQAK